MNHSLNTTKSITLIELIVSIIIVTMMVLSFYSLEIFSQGQVINSERRAKVQNQLAYVLEHMSKYVQQANGDKNNPPIIYYPNPPAAPTGFQVRYDCKSIQTPSDLTDAVWVYYTLNSSTHELSTGCSGANCGSCSPDRPVPPVSPGEVLSNKIIANFNNSIMPANPTDGFYVKVDPSGNLVDIGLVGRYDTSNSSSLTNPQVEMKTKIICNNSSTN